MSPPQMKGEDKVTDLGNLRAGKGNAGRGGAGPERVPCEFPGGEIALLVSSSPGMFGEACSEFGEGSTLLLLTVTIDGVRTRF